MPTISLSGPAELLTIIPFHLGFQPVRSVVVVCFHGKRLGLVARLDVVDVDLAGVVVAQTLPTLLTGSPSSVAVVGFEDEAGEALPLLDALAAGFEAARVVVRERLVVRDGRWYAVGCDCCPEEGRLLPEEADVPAVASYVALGRAVLPDREGLGALVEPLSPTEPRHDLTLAAIEDWQRRYAAAGCVVRDPRQEPRAGAGAGAAPAQRDRAGAGGSEGRCLTVLDGGDPTARQFLVNDMLLAWGGVLHGDIVGFGMEHWLPSIVGPLRDLQVRDAVVGWLCPGSVPLDAFPVELVAMLEIFLGPDLRVPAAGARPPDEPNVPWSGPDAELARILRIVSGDDDGDDDWDDDAEDDGDGDGDGGDGGDCDVDGRDAVDWGDWDEAAVPRLMLARLEEVCRLTPAAHAAPLLSVVASLAWWIGDGARAGVAVDRALALEPDHRLSQLVRESLDHGIRPRRCA
ncbi:DUF4192 family protein [Terrabacter sp. GCM10028922]|uniref:DUF4192 family protein n=1 Tax=Terrabacter sp. GCM10028922 TaxID=3273428 RepID=UPI00361A5D13